MRSIMGFILLVTFSMFIIAGCSSQTNTTSEIQESTQENQTLVPDNINKDFYDDAVEIIKMIDSKGSEELPLSEEEVRQIAAFSEKYPKLNDDEINIHDSIVLMSQANMNRVMAKLNNDFTEVQNQSKEYAFQKAKLDELLGLE